MIWHSQIELENSGPPTRRELFWAIAATPLLLSQIVIWSIRLIRSFNGEPLVVSSLLDISVMQAGGSWIYPAAVGFYLVTIVIVLFLLWSCTLELQRWAYWRRRS